AHQAARGVRQSLLRRTEAQSPFHGGESIAGRGLRQHAGCRTVLSAGAPTNPLKRARPERRLQIRLWSARASHIAREGLAGAGFDWILVDSEHAPNDVSAVHRQLQAMQGSPSSIVVRPAWNDAVLLKRLLDIGVQSFLVPWVQTEEEARRAVAATRYPPA